MKTLIKLILITFLLIVCTSFNELKVQTSTDTLEYKEVTIGRTMDNKKYKIWIEDNDDGTIIRNILKQQKDETYGSKMEALKVYSSEGWQVVNFCIDRETNTQIYLLKRKITNN